MIYRRRKGSRVWHWMPTCRWFPGREQMQQPIPMHWEDVPNYVEKDRKPTGGNFELCNECLSKERAAKQK